MSKTTEQVTNDLLRAGIAAYQSRDSRGALRAGLSSAATLADVIATEVHNENRSRGRTTSKGLELAAVADRIARAIWAMRDQVTVPK